MKLVYSALTSLDGYINDERGNFDWAAPDEEVHRFVNDLERGVGTYLFGRRMYEVMTFWETAHEDAALAPYALDYARIWQGADKIVYSRTLPAVATARTRLEREFDPAAVRRLKESARANMSVGGAHLAADALRAGLVDELQLFLMPVIVGGGTRVLPADVHLDLELVDQRAFAAGAVFVRYRVRRRGRA